MPKQEQVQPSKKTTPEHAEDETTTTEPRDNTDIDALLDEIDSVIEENAEQFVRDFQQKGGE